MTIYRSDILIQTNSHSSLGFSQCTCNNLVTTILLHLHHWEVLSDFNNFVEITCIHSIQNTFIITLDFYSKALKFETVKNRSDILSNSWNSFGEHYKNICVFTYVCIYIYTVSIYIDCYFFIYYAHNQEFTGETIFENLINMLLHVCFHPLIPFFLSFATLVIWKHHCNN